MAFTVLTNTWIRRSSASVVRVLTDELTDEEEEQHKEAEENADDVGEGSGAGIGSLRGDGTSPIGDRLVEDSKTLSQKTVV